MSDRRSLRSTILALVLIAALSPVSQVLAGWSYWNYADGTDTDIFSYWKYYPRERTTDVSPYGIWFHKTDGPSLEAMWVYCGYTYGGSVIPVSNDDPALGVYLKENYSAPQPLSFCLGFKNTSGGADSFTGELNWNN